MKKISYLIFTRENWTDPLITGHHPKIRKQEKGEPKSGSSALEGVRRDKSN